MKVITSIIALISLMVFASFGHAETQYIKDEIRIEMHSGPTTGYRIVRYLKSGDTLSVLSRSDDDKWLKISIKGKEGWIQARYATPTPIAKALLKKSELNTAALTQKNTALQNQLSEVTAELKSVKTLQGSLESTANSLKNKLGSIEKTANNAIITAKNYQLLQEQTELLNVKLEKLEEENKILENDNLEDGIIWGILAVIAGVILTLTIPKMSTQKRKGEW
ncbi:MAG: TIGR04211 family SH3 domain-containing protein [Pseudomonadales bacterium]|nr:TIGR04211 family SH3 domain-containing protein [Pseudomonadales bacterium]